MLPQPSRAQGWLTPGDRTFEPAEAELRSCGWIGTTAAESDYDPGHGMPAAMLSPTIAEVATIDGKERSVLLT
jgi:hypothetical protein